MIKWYSLGPWDAKHRVFFFFPFMWILRKLLAEEISTHGAKEIRNPHSVKGLGSFTDKFRFITS